MPQPVSEPKYAPIAAALQNDNAIVAAVPTKKIRLLGYSLSFSGTTNAKWRSATTDKSGLIYGVVNTQHPGGFNPAGHLETVAGEALNLHLSAAVAVGGHITYVEVGP